MFLRIIEAALTGFIAALVIMFFIFDLTKLKRLFSSSAKHNSERVKKNSR